jgi:transposase
MMGPDLTRCSSKKNQEISMSNVIEPEYDQQWLFPPSLEDLLPAGHPARLVREFVDALDLEQLGFKTEVPETGRPSYAVSLQIKVILYGYMNRVRSTRGWERACYNDVGMLWLTGMNYPDHTTLWRCWNNNRAGLRKLFRQLLQLATAANLVGMVLHAVDGTKILSAASEQQAWRRVSLEEKLKGLDQAINEIMQQTEESANESSGGGYRLPEQLQQREQLRELVRKQLSALNAEDRDHLNPQDPEARVMKCGARKQFAYNAQAVVDEQSKLIVAAKVVTDESDNYQLTPMLDEVKGNLGQVAQLTVADAGYLVTTQLAEAEQKGYSTLVNLQEPLQDAANQPYHASRFVYDAANDRCICPRGEALLFDQTKVQNKVQPYTVRVYRCQNYETCPVRWQCSSSRTGRTVQIHPNHDALVRQREKHRDEAMRAALKKRGSTVEPVFGWAKETMGFRRWAFRGLEKVQTQWLVLCTAMNLARLHKNWSEGNFRFA